MEQYNFFGALPFVVMWFVVQLGILLEVLVKNPKRATFLYSCIGLGLVAISAIIVYPQSGTTFQGMINFGGYVSFFDILFAVSGLLTIIAARPYLNNAEFEHDEFYSVVILAVSGMMLIARANNLLVLFIGIEVMSVSFYILSGYFRSNVRSIESALKYFLLGAFATGFLLYGIALMYGATGSIEYSALATSLTADSALQLYFFLGVALFLVGLSFKLAVFPFHQWAPDVYQGAPSVVTGFMSTAGKAAALSAFIPFTLAVFQTPIAQKYQLILAILSAGTMIIGNVSAVAQTNVKRMLAFSSVAHAGYLMMGLVSSNTAGLQGILYYSASYILMQIGAFVVVSVIEKNNSENLEFSDYAGLSKKSPYLAGLMSVFMLSLAGIPPFAGFFGKYLLFTSLLDSGFLWLVIVGVVSSVISLYFYLGLIVQMYFKDGNESELPTETGIASITLIVATIGVVLLGVLPSLLVNTFTFLPK